MIICYNDDKMKKKSILLILFLMIFLSQNVSANSAVRWWKGSDVNGSYVLEEDCPVVCEHEDLTFVIEEFPDLNYQDKEKFAHLNSTVSASYTLHNPGKEAIDVTLVFPFGSMPYYGNEFFYYEIKDLGGYQISCNGKPLDYRFRFTYSNGSGFEVREELEKLKEEKEEDSCYSRDLPIFQYIYEIDGEYPSDGTYLDVEAVIKTDSSIQTILYDDSYSYQDGILTLKAMLNGEKKQIVFVVIGESLKEVPEWTIRQEIEAKIQLQEIRIDTLEDYLLSNKIDADISDTDWYNACIACLNRYQGNPLIESLFHDVKVSSMQWLEYSLHFEAEETLNNTLTVPIYPDIDEGYSPLVYTYHYLLSPASTWADFQDLDVTVKTDYHLLNNEELQETQEGYHHFYESLPKQELSFSLSESENPSRGTGSYSSMIVILVLGFIIIIVLLGLFIVIGILKWLFRIFKGK